MDGECICRTSVATVLGGCGLKPTPSMEFIAWGFFSSPSSSLLSTPVASFTRTGLLTFPSHFPSLSHTHTRTIHCACARGGCLAVIAGRPGHGFFSSLSFSFSSSSSPSLTSVSFFCPFSCWQTFDQGTTTLLRKLDGEFVSQKEKPRPRGGCALPRTQNDPRVWFGRRGGV